MTNDASRLPGRLPNPEVHGPNGEQALMIDAVPVSSGQRVQIEFEGINGPRRQGLFVATDGLLRTEDAVSKAYTLWEDTAPRLIDMEVVETDGTLIFYNIWEKTPGAGFRSQAYTSGMLPQPLEDGWTRYRCQDFGVDNTFDSLTFRIRVSG